MLFCSTMKSVINTKDIDKPIDMTQAVDKGCFLPISALVFACLLVQFCFQSTPRGPQGLFLALCSDICPGSAMGTYGIPRIELRSDADQANTLYHHLASQLSQYGPVLLWLGFAFICRSLVQRVFFNFCFHIPIEALLTKLRRELPYVPEMLSQDLPQRLRILFRKDI